MLFGILVSAEQSKDLELYAGNGTKLMSAQLSSENTSSIISLTEMEIEHTANIKSEKPINWKYSVMFVWKSSKVIKTYDPYKEVVIDKIELCVSGLESGIGHITIGAVDEQGQRFICGKWSPSFSDAIHSITNLKILPMLQESPNESLHRTAK